MWHSVFSLQEKSGKYGSKLYVAYGLIAVFYIPFSPFFLIKYIGEYMGLVDQIIGYVGISISGVIFVLFILNTNKIHKKITSESS